MESKRSNVQKKLGKGQKNKINKYLKNKTKPQKYKVLKGIVNGMVD